MSSLRWPTLRAIQHRRSDSCPIKPVFIPIIVREWIKPKEGGVLYVGEKAKEKLFEKMMDNFTLPAPEVTQDDLDENPDEDPELILARKEKAMLELVKGFTSRKMAQQIGRASCRERVCQYV